VASQFCDCMYRVLWPYVPSIVTVCTVYCDCMYWVLWLYVPCIVSVCTEYCDCMYHVLWSYVPSIVTICTVYCDCMYHVLWLYVPCIVTVCTMYCDRMYCVLWPYVPCIVTVCTMYCDCMCRVLWPYVPCIVTVCTAFFNISKFYTLQYIYVFQMIVRTNSDYCISVNSINWKIFIMQTVFTVKCELNFYVFVTWNSYYPGLNSLSDFSLCRCVLDEQSAGGNNKNCACIKMQAASSFLKFHQDFIDM